MTVRWVRRIEAYFSDPRLSEVRRYENVVIQAELNARPVPTLVNPRVGDRVVCHAPDGYLSHYHGVVPDKTVGTISALSRLSVDDDGVLVDWGVGGEVRCDLRELSLAPMSDASNTVSNHG